MNKDFSLKKLNVTIVLTALFIVGIVFLIPNYVIGAKKIELTVNPTGKEIALSWETNASKIEEFVITRTAGEDTKLFYVKGDKYSFIDTQVEQRTIYSYKVTAKRKGKIIEESNIIENVILAKADNPHGMYSSATSMCSTCHTKREDIEGQSEAMAQAELCFSCHGDMKKHFNEVKISGSSHPFMSKDIDLKCTSCHNPHKTADESNPSILNSNFKFKDNSELKLNQVDEEFCFVCHSKGGQSSRIIDKEIYQSGTIHSDLSKMPINEAKSKISCYSCHVPHSSEFKSLLKFQFDPFSKKNDINNNQLCLSCHGNDSKTNILKLYNGNKDGENKGHYIKDQDLAKSLGLPIGWKLSCSDCHSTHGSKNNKGISDKLGDFSAISEPVKKERAICSSCHAYSNDSNQKSIFRGIFFAPLPDTVEQHFEKPNGDIKSCSSCHGDNNPVLGAHAPKSGLEPPKNKEETKEPAKEEPKPDGPLNDNSKPTKDSEQSGDTSNPPTEEKTNSEKAEQESQVPKP